MYFSIFKHSITDSLAYRFAVFIRLFTMAMFLSVMYFIFKAYYAGLGGNPGPVPFRTMIQYLAITQFVGTTQWSWLIMKIGENVRSGKIANELLRPYDYQFYNLAIAAGGSVSNLLTSGMPLLLLYVFVFKAGSALSVLSALAFALSIALGFLVRFSWNYIICSATFYIENTWGLSVASAYLTHLFSGAIIPLPLVPEPFWSIIRYSPFASMVYTPVGIGCGIIRGERILISLAVQLGWTTILALAGRFLFNRATRVITLHGG